MIAKDEDGNWYAVLAVGTAIPCRTKGEAERVSEQISKGIFVGIIATCITLLIVSSLILFFVVYA